MSGEDNFFLLLFSESWVIKTLGKMTEINLHWKSPNSVHCIWIPCNFTWSRYDTFFFQISVELRYLFASWIFFHLLRMKSSLIFCELVSWLAIFNINKCKPFCEWTARIQFSVLMGVKWIYELCTSSQRAKYNTLRPSIPSIGSCYLQTVIISSSFRTVNLNNVVDFTIFVTRTKSNLFIHDVDLLHRTKEQWRE